MGSEALGGLSLQKIFSIRVIIERIGIVLFENEFYSLGIVNSPSSRSILTIYVY